MKYKTTIYSSYSFGAWKYSFKKEFQLDFAPFFGLNFLDESDEYEISLRIENHQYQRADICYSTKENEFYVDVEYRLRENTSDETIDSHLELYKKAGWIRNDNSDINIIKELLKRNRE